MEFLGFKNNLTLYKPNTAGLQLQQLDSRNFRSNVNSTVKHTMQRMSVSISKSITKSGELLKVQLPNIPTKYTEISQQITYWHVTDETRAMFLTQYLKRQIKALNKWLFPSNMIRGLKILFDFTILEIERLLLPRNIMENKVDRVKLYYTLQKTFKVSPRPLSRDTCHDINLFLDHHGTILGTGLHQRVGVQRPVKTIHQQTIDAP